MKPELIFKSLFSEWPAKILSLAVALLLTLFFNLTRLEQRTVNIPLVVSINDEMAPSSQYPRTVKVVLRGERDVIYGIREDEISAFLDLAGFRNEGVFRVPVRLEKRGNALNADPLEIHPEPTEIAIGLERRVEKRIPVTPSFKGFLESGFELTSFDVEPSQVLISGPAGLVARTTEISTDTIELGGKKADFSAEVRILKKENLITIEGSESVLFSAKVRKAVDVRNVAGVPIKVRGLAPGLVLSDLMPSGNLRMHISEDTGATSFADDLLSIDLSAFSRAGTYTVDVEVRPPEGVIIETYEPQSLTVRLQGGGTGGQGGGLGTGALGTGVKQSGAQKPAAVPEISPGTGEPVLPTTEGVN